MDLWYTEFQTKNVGITCKIVETLHREKSKYQDIAVINTEQFGKMLVLDGTVQTTEVDEFIYHEMISHIPLFTHENPKNVLVIGGGDGGTVKEILKHKTVEKVVLVEIDEKVVEISKKFFPELSSELGNKKVEVRIEDGIKFVNKSKNEFDIILVDSTDPVGPAKGLFTIDFYKSIYEAMKNDGILVAQTESPYFHSELIKRVNSDLKEIFPIVNLYTCPIPTYPSGYWSFTLASKFYNPIEKENIFLGDAEFKYFTDEIFKSSFILPNFIKEELI